jgi:hypothetical protein
MSLRQLVTPNAQMVLQELVDFAAGTDERGNSTRTRAASRTYECCLWPTRMSGSIQGGAVVSSEVLAFRGFLYNQRLPQSFLDNSRCLVNMVGYGNQLSGTVRRRPLLAKSKVEQLTGEQIYLLLQRQTT